MTDLRESRSEDRGENRNERGIEPRRSGAAYQGALESVFSILIGVGLGYWADHSFGTSPLYLLIGLALGFGAFILRLVRLGRRLQSTDSAKDSAVGGKEQ